MTKDYRPFLQSAFKKAAHDILIDVAQNGLTDNTHYYISFHTDAPGIQMPGYLRAQYPLEMTIVLQHEFENLIVDSDKFSVVLGFGANKEQLTIPFASLMYFSDPDAQFTLSFFTDEVTSATPQNDAEIISIEERRRQKDKK